MKNIFLFTWLLCCGSAAVAQDLVIKNVLLWASPESGKITGGTIIIHNGKIVQAGHLPASAVPAGMPVLDGHGMLATAGFWNSHVHFTEVKWLGADTISTPRLAAQLQDFTTSRGFTHVFDLAELDVDNLKAIRKRIESGEVAGPAIRAVGVPLAPPNGSPVYIRPYKLPEIGTAAAAEQAVKAQLAAGAQGIKLFTASPNGDSIVPMPLPVALVAVQTAHAAGVPVFAHPSSAAGVQVAISAGVDILAHVSPDDHAPWPPANINAMLRKHMALVPTLKMFEWSLLTGHADTTNNPLISTMLQQLGAYAKAGGAILFGTDVGYMLDYDTEEEFALMQRAGLSSGAILASLTTAPAKRFGFSATSGQLAPGMDGDVVLLDGDPMQNSRDFAKVVTTIINGKIVYQK